MDINIIKSEDLDLLAKLSKDVQALHHEIEPTIFKPYTHENMRLVFQKVLSDPDATAYVAELSGEAIGYMVVTIKSFEDSPLKYAYKALLIDQICVESKFTGMGIGKMLIDFAKTLAKQNGLKRIEMNYWSRNPNSGEFFRSQGFEPFNEKLFFHFEA